MESALYTGTVWHARHVPKKHSFQYRIFLFWLNLEELADVEQKVRGFSCSKWSILRFNRADYLGDANQPLKQCVLQKMSQLANKPLDGKVFLLGQTRMFGMYFSPVNFYYLQQPDGHYSHMLAEVSNTPWNQRHCYLVDLADQQPSQKAFHVSPFNPMDMDYKWKIAQPNEKLKLTLSCFKDTRHFDASLNLSKQILNSKSLFNVMISLPSMTIKTVVGIYWQAFKLFIKGVPFYGHPDSNKKDDKC